MPAADLAEVVRLASQAHKGLIQAVGDISWRAAVAIGAFIPGLTRTRAISSAVAVAIAGRRPNLSVDQTRAKGTVHISSHVVITVACGT